MGSCLREGSDLLLELRKADIHLQPYVATRFSEVRPVELGFLSSLKAIRDQENACACGQRPYRTQTSEMVQKWGELAQMAHEEKV